MWVPAEWGVMPPANDVSPRDLVILKARVAHPKASTRQLSEILETSYGVSLSHNRINEILHELDDEGIIRQSVLPDRDLFNHYLLRVSFHFPNFAEYWEECYRFLLEDPHVLMFFTADTDYQWHVIAQFVTDEQMERWVHELFEEYGALIGGFHNTMLHNVHKFRTDPAIFDDLLERTDEGRRYLTAAETTDEADANR